MMQQPFIQLNKENIQSEHICCAISDKKCSDSYNSKKKWLEQEFHNGYVFKRIDERAKVFVEYGPAEKAWVPINAPNYLNINCMWVSGKYKQQGYGKSLLSSVIKDAEESGKSGLVTIVGTKKLHFMNDTSWLLKQGFQEVDRTDTGFSLLAFKLDSSADDPMFNSSVHHPFLPQDKGLFVFYSNRCPFSEFHAKVSLMETAEKRNLRLNIMKLSSMDQAQNAPTPATIFSLFYNGQYVTNDISVCLDSKFDKILEKANISIEA